MEEIKTKKRIALKVIALVIYLAITAFLLYGLIDAKTTEGSAKGLSMAVYLVFCVLIFGIIGNILALIPAIIGLVLSIISYDKEKSLGNVITFTILTVLPILTEAIFILICVLST